jgi:hypothetical protein
MQIKKIKDKNKIKNPKTRKIKESLLKFMMIPF